MKEGVDCGVGACQRRGMRARSARACRGRTGLQSEDRLAPGDPARNSGERPRVAERLEIEEDEVGCLVVLPPLEQVVRGDVGLVADRDEGGETECALRSLLEQRETECAALGREADPAGRERARGEGGVQSTARDGDAEAVGADEPSAVRAHEREQTALPLATSLAGLGEPGGDHAEGRHAVTERIRRCVEYMLGGQTDDREVDSIFDLTNRRVRADAGDRLPFEVDGKRGADEIGFEDVAEELAADRAAPPRGADHHDRGGGEERAQRGDDGGVVTFLHTRGQGAGRGEREAKLDLAALPRAHQLEPGVGEHRQSCCVRRHHLGDEPIDAGVARPAGELLEQAGADPAALLGVVDGERHLGSRAPADTCVAPHRDDPLLAIAVGQPAGQRAALRPVRIEQWLDEPRLDAPEPVEAQEAALVGQPFEECEQSVAICGQRSPQPKGAAVPEDDVDRFGYGPLEARRQRAPPCWGRAAARPELHSGRP